MKKYLFGLIATIIPVLSFAAEKGIDQKIDEAFGAGTGWFVQGIFAEIPVMEGVSIPWVLIVLVVGALFFTIYFRVINITGFKTAINIVRGKYDEIESGGDDHVEVSDTVHTVDGGTCLQKESSH